MVTTPHCLTDQVVDDIIFQTLNTLVPQHRSVETSLLGGVSPQVSGVTASIREGAVRRRITRIGDADAQPMLIIHYIFHKHKRFRRRTHAVQ